MAEEGTLRQAPKVHHHSSEEEEISNSTSELVNLLPRYFVRFSPGISLLPLTAFVSIHRSHLRQRPGLPRPSARQGKRA